MVCTVSFPQANLNSYYQRALSKHNLNMSANNNKLCYL